MGERKHKGRHVDDLFGMEVDDAEISASAEGGSETMGSRNDSRGWFQGKGNGRVGRRRETGLGLSDRHVGMKGRKGETRDGRSRRTDEIYEAELSASETNEHPIRTTTQILIQID